MAVERYHVVCRSEHGDWSIVGGEERPACYLSWEGAEDYRLRLQAGDSSKQYDVDPVSDTCGHHKQGIMRFCGVLAMVLLTSHIAHAQASKPAPPPLPNFLEMPYSVFETVEDRAPVFHPEWGPLQRVVYSSTGNDFDETTNFITVYRDKNGDLFYAEWSSPTDQKRRGYRMEKGAWVFEREKSTRLQKD